MDKRSSPFFVGYLPTPDALKRFYRPLTIPLIFACAVFLALLTWTIRVRPSPPSSGQVRRRARWGPMLRAPPFHG